MTACPCCAQAVDVPDLETLIEDRGITGSPAALLRAVWAARGHRLPTERVFDALFADDPNGGPSPSSMYLRTRRAHQYLNEALAGSGVSVVRVRGGWRLRMPPRL